MSLNLLLFNLATDADDPILGFTTHWVNRLAAHFDHIDVVTMRAGRLTIADNVKVHTVGKELGYSEPRRAAEFYRILGGLLASKAYMACFAHMMPLFAAMGAPLLRLRGVPITLWYTHRQVTRVLEVATRASQRVVTAAPDSFPIPTPRLRVLGHGIDTDFYQRRRSGEQGIDMMQTSPTRPKLTRTQEMIVLGGGYVVQVARMMPIKHQETAIRALEHAPDTRLVLIGGTPQGEDGSYEHKLRGLAHGMDLGGRVVFAGDQPPELLREYYQRAGAALNLSPPGLFDKAALESMAMELPTIVANPAFDPLLGEHVDLLRVGSSENVNGLAGRLNRLYALPEAMRAAIGAQLRERVVAAHGLDGLTTRLVNVLKTGEP
ncbi:MAG: glycosyltransferase family 4 protein [Chloroflexota bacterium]|nr:glycosyltransferase family 4 protein [Chloroflexota bacterium]